MSWTSRIKNPVSLGDKISRAYVTHLFATAFAAMGLKKFVVEEVMTSKGLGYKISWDLNEQASGEGLRLQQYRDESKKRYEEIKKAREERDKKLFQSKELERKTQKLKELQEKFKEIQQKYREMKNKILAQAIDSLQNRLNRMTETGKLENNYKVTSVVYDSAAKALRFKVELS